ncbi:MAG: hypothetical protein KY393_01305, partial [Actinobacteria bacterium]|nr:hypothetical protein [Actinomycetota bacterium]
MRYALELVDPKVHQTGRLGKRDRPGFPSVTVVGADVLAPADVPTVDAGAAVSLPAPDPPAGPSPAPAFFRP